MSVVLKLNRNDILQTIAKFEMATSTPPCPSPCKKKHHNNIKCMYNSPAVQTTPANKTNKKKAHYENTQHKVHFETVQQAVCIETVHQFVLKQFNKEFALGQFNKEFALKQFNKKFAFKQFNEKFAFKQFNEEFAFKQFNNKDPNHKGTEKRLIIVT